MPEGNIIITELAAWLLLGLLAIVVLLVFLFTALILRLSRRRQLEGSVLLRSPGDARFQPLRWPVNSFATRPSRWLAVRSTQPEAVQRAFELVDATPCSLADGLSGADDHELFISPPIRGWIIVTGSSLPDPADDVDHCFLRLRQLSSELGEVQFFSVNRALSIHSWARLLTGEVFRAFAWAGTTIWTQGELTRAEKDLGMHCPKYGEEDGPSLFAEHHDPAQNAEKVPLLAARWSLDPARIDTARNWPRPGIARALRRT